MPVKKKVQNESKSVAKPKPATITKTKSTKQTKPNISKKIQTKAENIEKKQESKQQKSGKTGKEKTPLKEKKEKKPKKPKATKTGKPKVSRYVKKTEEEKQKLKEERKKERELKKLEAAKNKKEKKVRTVKKKVYATESPLTYRKRICLKASPIFVQLLFGDHATSELNKNHSKMRELKEAWAKFIKHLPNSGSFSLCMDHALAFVQTHANDFDKCIRYFRNPDYLSHLTNFGLDVRENKSTNILLFHDYNDVQPKFESNPFFQHPYQQPLLHPFDLTLSMNSKNISSKPKKSETLPLDKERKNALGYYADPDRQSMEIFGTRKETNNNAKCRYCHSGHFLDHVGTFQGRSADEPAWNRRVCRNPKCPRKDQEWMDKS